VHEEPVGRSVALHTRLALHCAGEVQLLHAAPFVPHAELLVPATHVPAEQQPLGQVIDPHPMSAPSVPVTLTEPEGFVAASTITYTVTVAPVVLFQPVVSATPVPPAFTPATQVRESHAATLVARLSEMSSPLAGVAVTVRLRLFGIEYATTKSGPVEGVWQPVPVPS
jgi:hypothetical protein